MFDKVVILYRLLGKPSLEDSHTVTKTIDMSNELIAVLDELADAPGEVGEFEYARPSTQLVKVVATFPQGSFRFFNSIDELVQANPSFKQGKCPTNFYVASEDYGTCDPEETVGIARLKRATEFVHALRKFSVVNLNSDDLAGSNKLFFIRPADAKGTQKTVVIPITLSSSFCNFEIPSFGILNALANPENADHLHIEERRLIMGVAIADVVKQQPEGSNPLEYLARNWKDAAGRYRQDLISYVGKFSFDLEKKKIADAAIEYSSKLGTTLNDMTSKLLAAPISLGVLAAIYKLGGNVEFGFGCAGVIIAMITYNTLLNNQARQIARIAKAYKLVLSGYQAKKKTFPKQLQLALDDFENDRVKQELASASTIQLYKAVAWSPAAGLVWLAFDRVDTAIWSKIGHWLMTAKF